MNSKEEIFEKIREKLVEMFELDPSKVTLSANVYSDLDLDSIDAIDIIIKLQEITGKKVQPESFKAVRTVEDMVDAVHALLNEDS